MRDFEAGLESVQESLCLIRVFALDELQIGVDERGPQELVQLVLVTISVSIAANELVTKSRTL